MRTVLALIAAAAMIAAAVIVRSGDALGGRASGPSAPAGLVCITELEAVCEQLAGDDIDVRVEEAGVTAELLSSGEPVDDDAWLTLAPWRDITIDARSRASLEPLPDAGSAVLARSPLVLVLWRDRAAALAQACGVEVRWRCIGAHAGDDWSDLNGEPSWGLLKPAHADPSDNATGLLVLGQAAGDFFGDTDFTARDLDRDAFLAWLTKLEEGVPATTSGGTPLQRMLTFGASTLDVVGTTEAEAVPMLRRSARGDDATVVYPEPVAVAEVVLAPVDGEGFERIDDIVQSRGVPALEDSGWRVDGQPADGSDPPALPSEPPLPSAAQLPSAGVLDALRLRVEEIR